MLLPEHLNTITNTDHDAFKVEGQSNDECSFLPIGSAANAGAVTADYSDR